MRFLFSTLLLAAVLSSCGTMQKAPERNKTGKTLPRSMDPLNPMNLPEHLRKQQRGDGVQAGMAPVEVGELTADQSGVKMGGQTLYNESDIMWSDDARPDADIQGLEEVLAKPKRTSNTWEVSFKEARRKSWVTGKPVLMWFTRKGKVPSTVCVRLKRELFGKPSFRRWSDDHLVRMQVDLAAGSSSIGQINNNDRNSNISRAYAQRSYVEGLKKRYKAFGLPTVLVLGPEGEVISRYRGYKKDDADFYWGRIKSAALNSQKDYKSWHQKMGKKGYRVWTGVNGVSVYAKVVSYRKGNLVLLEPDGGKIKILETRLSNDDLLWLQAEKERRMKKR